jgi:ABC1 atypical kinase-like domain
MAWEVKRSRQSDLATKPQCQGSDVGRWAHCRQIDTNGSWEVWWNAHFARWRDVCVPRIYPELSTRRVLVTEYITGIKVTDTARLAAAGGAGRVAPSL